MKYFFFLQLLIKKEEETVVVKKETKEDNEVVEDKKKEKKIKKDKKEGKKNNKKTKQSGPMHFTANNEPRALDVLGDLDPSIFNEVLLKTVTEKFLLINHLLLFINKSLVLSVKKR